MNSEKNREKNVFKASSRRKKPDRMEKSISSREEAEGEEKGERAGKQGRKEKRKERRKEGNSTSFAFSLLFRPDIDISV